MDCPSFLTRAPVIHHTAFIAPNATVIGDVTVGADSSVWYQSVLRADIERIVIGEGSNIQDSVVIHLASDRGVSVGDLVTVGHRAIIHACTLSREVLVGMGAIVMDGTEVGERSIIGAGAVLTKNQRIPPGSLVLGNPARVVRALSQEEQQGIRRTAEKYVHVGRFHREKLLRAGGALDRV